MNSQIIHHGHCFNTNELYVWVSTKRPDDLYLWDLIKFQCYTSFNEIKFTMIVFNDARGRSVRYKEGETVTFSIDQAISCLKKYSSTVEEFKMFVDMSKN